MVVDISSLPNSPEEIAERAAAAAAARDTANANGAPPLVDHALGEGRRLRVVVIGAGFSGIGAAIYLPMHVDNLELQVYERAADVGGVWNANRYMGVACDIPAHTYQYTFANNTQWSKFYAGGAEIHNYLSKVTDHYGLRPLIKLQHEVVEARWNGDQWVIKVKNLASGEIIEDVCDFVCYSPGLLSTPVWPKIPGREKYKGIIHHSGNWDAAKEEAEGMDWSNKTVGVIGVGSSAIQIVPEMQRKCKKLFNFGRSKTWITGTFGDSILEKMGVDVKKQANYTFSDVERKRLQDPEFYHNFRLGMERELGSVHFITHRDSPAQAFVKGIAEEKMRTMLETKPDIANTLIPNFPVGCKRLTPGPGYLDALTKDNVEFVTTDLECFTETGIRTVSGDEYELDAIICATGFDTSSVPRFPIYGVDGVNLQDLWAQEPRTYLALGVPRMPNFFSILGPQSAVGSGNLLIVIEGQLVYAAKAMNKCQREGYKSMVIKDSAVDAFMEYTDNYFARTVFTSDCKSWYKNGGRGAVRTLWPGSSQHAIFAFRHPRWEDYDWERLPEYPTSMSWLGDGHIPAEVDPGFYYEELRSRHTEHPHFC